MPKPKRHVFVCINSRPSEGRASCAAGGSMDLLRNFQLRITKDPALREHVMVSGSDCLGPCFDGPNTVIYPDNVWYCGVGIDDIDEIVNVHLTKGETVERLLYSFPDDDE